MSLESGQQTGQQKNPISKDGINPNLELTPISKDDMSSDKMSKLPLTLYIK